MGTNAIGRLEPLRQLKYRPSGPARTSRVVGRTSRSRCEGPLIRPARSLTRGRSRREVTAEPAADPLVLPLASGYGENRTLRFIDGRVWLPCPFVDLNEDAEGYPGSALVPVGKWVVACESLEQDGGLVDELGIKLVLAETGEGRV